MGRKSLIGCGAISALTANLVMASGGEVLWNKKISAIEGGFQGALVSGEQWGTSITALDDLDGNGVPDLAVGANVGNAVRILLLAPDLTVLSEHKITAASVGAPGDLFGNALACLGDLDGDGRTELAVGEPFNDDGGHWRGSVWILSLESDGSVSMIRKISDTQGGFTGVLHDDDLFGVSVVSLGDHDGDGVTDIAVGSLWDDDGGTDHGAIWILFLNNDCTVKDHQKISDTEGGFTGQLDDEDRLVPAGALGDLDGDGVGDLAAATHWDDDGGMNRGAIWILFLNEDGTVKSHQKISDTEGGFEGELDDGDEFAGGRVIGDLTGDGRPEIVATARLDDDGGDNAGAVWILSLNPDGTVAGHQKISDTHGQLNGDIDANDVFGNSAAPLGDLDGDGVPDIAVGAVSDDDGGEDLGAVWLLFLEGNCPWDVNGDGFVNVEDLVLLILSWGGGAAGPPDFDNDRNVSVTDLVELILNWGPCPEP